MAARSTGGARRTASGAGRFPLVFAVVGVAVVLAATALYAFRAQDRPPRLDESRTVHEFLSAVFLAGTAERVAPYVCGSWAPDEAVTRTRAEVGPDVRVSWDEIRVISTGENRANVSARLGLRSVDDVRPGSYAQWRFSLIDEDGWRVCDARPFVV